MRIVARDWELQGQKHERTCSRHAAWNPHDLWEEARFILLQTRPLYAMEGRRIWGSGFRVEGFGFRVQGVEFYI